MAQWGGIDDYGTSGITDGAGGGGEGGNTLSIPPAYTPPPMAPSFPIAGSGSASMGMMPPMAGFDPFSSMDSGGGGMLPSPMSSMGGGFGGPSSGGGGGLGGLLGLLGGGGGGGLGGLLGGGSGLGSLMGLGTLLGGGGLGGFGLAPLGGSPFTGLAGSLGGGLAGLIGGSGPNFNSGSAGMGGGIGSTVGGLAGLALGPLGSLGGAFLGDLLGSLLGGYIGGGLPKMAKPQGFVNALEGSGDPLEKLLGGYMQKYGINRGLDLSESKPTPGFQPTAMANVLELLGGQQMTDLHGTTLTPPGQTGYKHPVGLAVRKLAQLQGLVPNATELNTAQLKMIMPQIEQILLHRGQYGHGLPALLGAENDLATKLRNATTY
jgi:hypothetical protein